MTYNDNEIAIYLFCAQLYRTGTTPLTILEWNAVVKSLANHNLQPKELLKLTPSELLSILTYASEQQKPRIARKIDARKKLGISTLELEEMTHKGYGIMFRTEMPAKIKKLTQHYLPAFFYFAGDPNILSQPLLGVVGARNATDEELSQTAVIVEETVPKGMAIISGGAKGVDTVAVETALKQGGKAIIFPADGLARWVKKREIRSYIMNNQLLIMSTQRLEAPFSGAYAMQRNKFIHAPSNAVLVASSKISGAKSSGTWEGVQENIKNRWSPIFVLGKSEGVLRLLEEGHAKPFSSIKDFYINNHNFPLQKVHFEEKIKALITLAEKNELDRKTIEQTFLSMLEQHFEKENKQKSNDKHEEQLTIWNS
ncbi:DNA-processing protein DprA [Alkalihalobacillus sp. 1P02AB]|uniref:DNA-processing protein DprA n=1 Tax=Alkalihalobacillus sp. 1P02AB TaxID=3132260 RepID=UPI0039A77CED